MEAGNRRKEIPVSELTPCNFCSLKRMKERAELSGKEVILRGLDAYIVPKGQPLPTDPAELEKAWAAWFMELTNHCVC